ncbi:MAG: SRPBCC family protein [Actinobacteria bacterium]|nr:MAG: SRPBCC family protein [Actinomycetota bacterium]
MGKEATAMADEVQQLKDDVSSNGSGSRLSGLTNKSVLFPVAAAAASAAAAGLASKKGPDLMKKLQGEADEEGEELGKKGLQGLKKGLESSGMVGKLASKAIGGGGGDGGQKGGRTRRLPIQRWTDVAVPVDKAYRAWTQFEEFPKFMHRVLEVKKEDQNKIHWREKIWFSTREWDGEITDRRKNDRIAWKSVSGTQHSGVISFHKLDANLTRVLVTVDFVPTGMIEKMASGMRFAKRAVQADLARFKAYVEMGDAKGLEYKSTPDEMEQRRDDDGGGDDQEAQSRSGEDDSRDDGARDSDREERASRREERRKSLASS